MISISLNGEARDLPADTDLRSLLEHFSLPDQRIAVEINGSVVRRADWPSVRIGDGDRIEVVHFVGGG